MHELGVTFTVLDTVEKIANENGAEQVYKITLELGEVSTVIPEYLEKCFKWSIAKRQMFTDCALAIEKIPAVTYCEECRTTYPTVEHGRICPNCGSERTYLVQGNEFKIRDIEVG